MDDSSTNVDVSQAPTREVSIREGHPFDRLKPGSRIPGPSAGSSGKLRGTKVVDVHHGIMPISRRSPSAQPIRISIDFIAGRGEPTVNSDDPVSAEAIKAQLGAAYDRFDGADQALHVELLRSISRPEDVALHVAPARDEHRTVTVCASDAVGALSIISGLFTAYRLDIRRVDVFTLHFPRHRKRRGPRQGQRARTRPYRAVDQAPTRRILDVFEVRGADSGVDVDLWREFRSDLAGLIALSAAGEQERAQEQVIDRVSEAVRGAGDGEPQLFPVHIDVTNDASPKYTQLDIRSADTMGFLFAFTNALTMLNVSIQRAVIRTAGGEVRDTLWLTDSRGRKIVAKRRIDGLRVAAALIKHLTHLLPRSPNPALALRQFSALTHQMLSRPDWTKEMRDLESMAVLEVLAELMGVSRFLWEDFLRMQHENLFPVVLDMRSLDQLKSKQRLRRTCQRQLRRHPLHADQVQELNRFKDREMFRIDLRHITHRIGFREFSEELTDLAEVVVEKAAGLSHDALEQRPGAQPVENARSRAWCICALGKFGGRELGFGSDVELILVYEGESSPCDPSVIESSRYFGDLVHAFTGTLKTQREGIFEIDLRLRPYGNAGAPATTLSTFNAYYSDDGPARQFERMALVKLRPVAGDAELGAGVLRSRDAFVYSGRPLDVQNILHLRKRQASELVPLGATSAKYSPGGLVDLEYFVQARQIAVGHTDANVRVTNTLDAFDRLVDGGHMPHNPSRELRETYEFIRRLIDALRVVRGHARDLTVPATDSREFAYLTQRLRFGSDQQLKDTIAARMDFARRVWEYGVPAIP